MAQKNETFKDWKEGRRKRAFELKEQGWKQRQIAAALGVSEAAVSQWLAKGGTVASEAWRSKPHRSGPLKIRSEALRQLPDFLTHGAEAYGFRGEVWTCGRVGKVIEEEFGVVYHKAHVSRLLKALHWTPQLPHAQATQRDAAAIAQWRSEVWPALKKKRIARA